jgi:hypothetical protein
MTGNDSAKPDDGSPQKETPQKERQATSLMGHRGKNQRLEVRPHLIGGRRNGLNLSRSLFK